MIEKLYTNKCTALVGENGRALSGEALEKAEKALREATASGYKIWFDKNGSAYVAERALFASPSLLVDEDGHPVRICGKRVHIAAKFCSKCGSASPHGWWRCGGCGKRVGNDSRSCPHCGKVQNLSSRLNMADGHWQKNEEIFAESFEYADVKTLLGQGLNVQENQIAVLLEGGVVIEVLEKGFYPVSKLEPLERTVGEQTIVMVDNSEFMLPICVGKLRTGDDIEVDLHMVAVLQFDKSNVNKFMRNLMGNSLYLRGDGLISAVGYDEIARSLLQELDSAVREFCNAHTVTELFKNPDLRITLEDYVASRVSRTLVSQGVGFVRIKELEFESEVFEELRFLSGEVEAKRREIEFMRRADELANDATRREAMSEFEMEDYMTQLAHEKGIKDELRIQELERMKYIWEQKKEKEALAHENALDDLQQASQLERDYRDAEHEQEVLGLQRKKELERRLMEQNSTLDNMQIEAKIQEIRLKIEKDKADAEQETTKGWLEIKQQKQDFNQQKKIEMMQAAANMDIKSLLMAEDDPAKREHLLRLHEQELQSKMTPELLLAAAAARGNPAAAAALSSLNQEQLRVIEQSKTENKALYEQMLQMSERMFSKAAESMAKASEKGSGSTTQIIK